MEQLKRYAREAARECEELGIDWRSFCKGKSDKDLPILIIKMNSLINWKLIDEMAEANDREHERLKQIQNLGW